MQKDIIVNLSEKNFLKASYGKYIIYDRKWLLEHLDSEYEMLKQIRDNKEFKPFSVKEFDEFVKTLCINDDE